MKKTPRRFKSRAAMLRYSTRKAARKYRKRAKRLHHYAKKRDRISIHLPKLITLAGEYRKPLIDAVERIRSAAHSVAPGKIRLDFSEVKKCYAPGMLYLLAAIDTTNRIANRIVFQGVKIRDPVVRQLIKQIGLGELIGVNDNITVSQANVRYWRFATDCQVNAEQPGEQFDSLCDEHGINEEDKAALYNAFAEAIDNAISHGYDTEIIGSSTRKADFPPDRRWWMFFGISGNQLSIVVCDLGLGIPETIRVKGGVERLKQTLSELFNTGKPKSSLIQAAIHDARSRTGQAHRGIGMGKMRQAVEKFDAGQLAVYSNEGEYYYTHRYKTPENTNDYPQSIGGTVIFWRVPTHGYAEVNP